MAGCRGLRQTVSVAVDDFGSYKDKNGDTKQVKRFTWNNGVVTIQIINFGATITSIKVPDKNGKVDDIVTGFDTIEEYLDPIKNVYHGATIGRVANRIAKGKMKVEGVEYTLAINQAPNHLHGGLQAFDKVLWDYYVKGSQVILSYYSAHLEEGYPGDLIASISYELKPTNEFHISYKATVTKPSPVNLTNHSYFNLGGHGSGPEELFKHEITVNADRYSEVDNDSTPSGNLLSVSGTVFDLRVPKVMGDGVPKIPGGGGYDHNYCVTRATDQDIVFVAKAYHPPSGRIMEVYSNQPGVQFYTGKYMPEDDNTKGKGATYKKFGAFCVETQIYPDAINHANFPNVVLYPGETYHHFANFKFLLEK